MSCSFNVHYGYLEGIVRGFKSGLLTRTDYQNLMQSENLEDVKLHLQETDYNTVIAYSDLANVSEIEEKLQESFVTQFNYLRNHATGKLSQFLDYITYGYMIENVVLLITGVVHDVPISELLSKCHPLGSFMEMGAIHLATSSEDLYKSIMVDTPLGPYFGGCLSEQDLDETNVEIIRNALYKAYLEDFYDFVKTLDSVTAEVMGEILEFEADRRAFLITINSIGRTEMAKDDRFKLYPSCGRLSPFGYMKLALADSYDNVRAVADIYADYKLIFDDVGATKDLEEKLLEHEVYLNVNSFMNQFSFSVFYSFVRLKEQEIRNISWICECITHGNTTKIDNYIPTF